MAITLVENDKDFDLNFALKKSDNTAFDMTGYAGSFFMSFPSATIVQASGAIVIDTAASGLAHYVMSGTNLNTVGTFVQEIQLTSGTQILTFKGENIVVVAELPPEL